MVMAHMQEAPAPPSQKTELPIPASLDRVVMACLAKKPEDRPATAEALARMLEESREIEPWTQDEAEKWWISNRPGFVIRADDTQPGDSVSASALPTM
jgi:eukaryotic-like serine/threonine-protein kinase